MIQLTESITTMPILVHAFHTVDSGGGYDWCPDTEENRAVMLGILRGDRDARNYDTGVLVSLTLKGVPSNWEAVNAYLEWQLADSIEEGSVGHIIERYLNTTTDSVN